MALALVRTKDEIPGSIPGQDYLVFSGELRLGRIHKVAMTGGRERWHWNLFALVGPSDRIAHDGLYRYAQTGEGGVCRERARDSGARSLA